MAKHEIVRPGAPHVKGASYPAETPDSTIKTKGQKIMGYAKSE